MSHDPEICGCENHADHCPYNPSSEFYAGDKVRKPDFSDEAIARLQGALGMLPDLNHVRDRLAKALRDLRDRDKELFRKAAYITELEDRRDDYCDELKAVIEEMLIVSMPATLRNKARALLTKSNRGEQGGEMEGDPRADKALSPLRELKIPTSVYNKVYGAVMQIISQNDEFSLTFGELRERPRQRGALSSRRSIPTASSRTTRGRARRSRSAPSNYVDFTKVVIAELPRPSKLDILEKRVAQLEWEMRHLPQATGDPELLPENSTLKR